MASLVARATQKGEPRRKARTALATGFRSVRRRVFVRWAVHFVCSGGFAKHVHGHTESLSCHLGVSVLHLSAALALKLHGFCLSSHVV